MRAPSTGVPTEEEEWLDTVDPTSINEEPATAEVAKKRIEQDLGTSRDVSKRSDEERVCFLRELLHPLHCQLGSSSKH